MVAQSFSLLWQRLLTCQISSVRNEVYSSPWAAKDKKSIIRIDSRSDFNQLWLSVPVQTWTLGGKMTTKPWSLAEGRKDESCRTYQSVLLAQKLIFRKENPANLHTLDIFLPLPLVVCLCFSFLKLFMSLSISFLICFPFPCYSFSLSLCVHAVIQCKWYR